MSEPKEKPRGVRAQVIGVVPARLPVLNFPWSNIYPMARAIYAALRAHELD